MPSLWLWLLVYETGWSRIRRPVIITQCSWLECYLLSNVVATFICHDCVRLLPSLGYVIVGRVKAQPKRSQADIDMEKELQELEAEMAQA